MNAKPSGTENEPGVATARNPQHPTPAHPSRVGAPIAPPRFVSEAYFMDFKFEPGNYYLAGREQLEGQRGAADRVLPDTNLFNDDDDEKRETRDAAAKDAKDDKAQEKKPSKEKKDNDKEAKLEQDIERKMNKTALVTLWVDPAEHQIVKYTFDNVWLDFLPGGWLVKRRRYSRVDDDGPAVPWRVAAARYEHPRGRHAGQWLARGGLRARVLELQARRREDAHHDSERRPVSRSVRRRSTDCARGIAVR